MRFPLTPNIVTPRGRLRPQAFIGGAAAVYLIGLASQWLTAPEVMTRAGPWPFIAAQMLLVWIWFVLHARRLHDAGRGAGLAVGVALLYLLSIALLLIVAFSFVGTSGGLMGNAGATGALGLIIFVYVIGALAGSAQYDIAWAVVAILVVMAILPVVVALGFTAWAATRPSAEAAAADGH